MLRSYRCWVIPQAAVRAAACGAQWVDTTTSHRTGRAQSLLASALAARPFLKVSTMVGSATSPRPPASPP
ncbi:hypothetical protein ACH47Z_39390 [Streptomyces sp. NPDC020192]|uniref:hypothetical protein n=1 Tax=Streptomyces sp. NPDC020192 TaxID=3365066 RepID=UPI00379292B1